MICLCSFLCLCFYAKHLKNHIHVFEWMNAWMDSVNGEMKLCRNVKWFRLAHVTILSHFSCYSRLFFLFSFILSLTLLFFLSRVQYFCWCHIKCLWSKLDYHVLLTVCGCSDLCSVFWFLFFSSMHASLTSDFPK